MIDFEKSKKSNHNNINYSSKVYAYDKSRYYSI